MERLDAETCKLLNMIVDDADLYFEEPRFVGQAWAVVTSKIRAKGLDGVVGPFVERWLNAKP
jgi:hypothetical protein